MLRLCRDLNHPASFSLNVLHALSAPVHLQNKQDTLCESDVFLHGFDKREIRIFLIKEVVLWLCWSRWMRLLWFSLWGTLLNIGNTNTWWQKQLFVSSLAFFSEHVHNTHHSASPPQACQQSDHVKLAFRDISNMTFVRWTICEGQLADVNNKTDKWPLTIHQHTHLCLYNTSTEQIWIFKPVF